MKQEGNLQRCKAVLLTVSIGLFLVGQVSAAPITISVSSSTVALGNQAVDTLSISGLGGGTALGTYDLNIGFDPSILSFNKAVFGTGLDVLGLGDIQSFTPRLGTLNLFELSLDSASDLTTLQSSSFVLATLTFNTTNVGTSPLTITANALGDQDGKFLSASLQNGSVSVTGASTSTPEPGTGGAMAFGLAAFIYLKRRQFKPV